jgi:hypothetical protein
MLSKEETSRNIQILLKFGIIFGVTLYLIKFRFDKLIYVFSVLCVSQFYAVLTKILFRKHVSWLAPLYLFYYTL